MADRNKVRSNSCPKCGSKLLARVMDKNGDNIICLNFNCGWHIEARRKEDREIQTLGEIKADWE